MEAGANLRRGCPTATITVAENPGAPTALRPGPSLWLWVPSESTDFETRLREQG